jgi:hypothetical protein
VSSRRPIRVTLSGDRSGEYVVVQERPDGSLVLEPEESRRSAARPRQRRPARGGLAALLSGMVTNSSGDGPETVPGILGEWGVTLSGDERVRDFLAVEVNGVAGFAAITTARMIFVPRSARGPGHAREYPLAGLRSTELAARRRGPRLRVTWTSGETTIQGARDDLDRLTQALEG